MSYQEKTELERAGYDKVTMCDILEKPKWKSRTPWINEPEHAFYLGMSTPIKEMIAWGWKFYIETNRYSGSKKVVAEYHHDNKNPTYIAKGDFNKIETILTIHKTNEFVKHYKKSHIKYDDKDITEFSTKQLLEIISNRIKDKIPKDKFKKIDNIVNAVLTISKERNEAMCLPITKVQ